MSDEPVILTAHPWLAKEVGGLTAIQDVLRRDTAIAFECYQAKLAELIPHLQEAQDRNAAANPDAVAELLTWTNMAVRTLATWADGSASFMCRLARRAVGRGELEVSSRDREDLARLRDLASSRRIKLGFKSFDRLLGTGSGLDAGGQEWEAFLEILDARHSSTHPSQIENLFKSGTTGGLLASLEWYWNQESELMWRCRRSFGLATIRTSPKAPTFEIVKDMPKPESLPYDEIAKDTKASMRLHSAHLSLVRQELSQLMGWSIQQDRDENPQLKEFAERMLIRSLVMSLEGLTASTERLLDDRDRGGEPLPRPFRRRIESARSGPEKLAAVLDAMASKHGSEFRVDRTASAWSALRMTWPVRDRLTHPRSAEDLIVSLEVAIDGMEAVRWFGDEVVRHHALEESNADPDS